MPELGQPLGFSFWPEAEADAELRTWIRCLTPNILTSAPGRLIVHLVATQPIDIGDIDVAKIGFLGEVQLHPLPEATLSYDEATDNFVHDFSADTLPKPGRYQLVAFIRFKTQRKVWRFPMPSEGHTDIRVR